MWYPQSTTSILKFLEKIAPPKPQVTQEAYLTLPEDDADFPIAVSGEKENEISRESIEQDENSAWERIDGDD